MANTVIALKKSATPTAVPSAANLTYGELAINYSDGKLYFKNTNDQVVEISGAGGGGNYFGTVNANGTLVVADTSGDVFSLVPGPNIEITADAINDTITIAASGTISSTDQVARDAAAVADAKAVAAFNKANTANITADLAYDKANAANLLTYNTGIGANSHANSVGFSANAFANTVGSSANAYAAAIANTIAILAYDKANSANYYAYLVDANSKAAFDKANSITFVQDNTIANLAYDKANSAYANALFANTVAIAAFDYANGITFTQDNTIANLAYDKANAANLLAYNTGIGSNVYTDAANTFLRNTIAGANAAVGTGANSHANSVGFSANAFANTVGSSANAYTDAANVFLTNTIAGANIIVGAGANAYSDITFLKLTAPNQTITGNLNIVGNVTLSGNTFTVDTLRLNVTDPLIYLAGNNYSSDIVDIGFIANYVNTGGYNVHTGFFRDASIKEYYLFQEYNQEPINNVIDPQGNNFTLAVLNADLKTSNLVLAGINAVVALQSAFDKANSANYYAWLVDANAKAAFDYANTLTFTQDNTIANLAYDKANTIPSKIANGFSNVYVYSSGNVTFSLSNIANVFTFSSEPFKQFKVDPGIIIGTTTSGTGYFITNGGYESYFRQSEAVIATASGVGAIQANKLLLAENPNRFVTITSPVIDASITLTLPSNTGQTGQVLQTDGTGILSWVNSGGSSTDTFARNTANAAFDKANNALANTDGATFNGSLILAGSLTTTNIACTNTISFGVNSSKDKIRLYDSETPYAMGMANYMTFGPLRNDWAMTFQMNDDIDRGFWWGDVAHTNGQGAMALTTDGNLYIASKLRLGYGESDTTDQEFWSYGLDVAGNVNVSSALFISGTHVFAFANTVGTSANAFASATIAGANTAVGAGANAYTDAANTFLRNTIAGANTAVGAGANAYTDAANTFLRNTIAGANASSNGWTNTVFGFANSKFIANNVANTATFLGNVYVTTANVLIGRTTESTIGQAVKLDVAGGVNASALLINGVALSSSSGGAKGGGTDDIFYENSQNVNSNYTITTNKNAMTTGPILIKSGVTVTVPSGSRWVII